MPAHESRMAPRGGRGRGGSGDGGGDISKETITIPKIKSPLRTPYMQSFRITVAVVILMLILFILGVISLIRWCVAELLLFAAFVYIIHNRLRAAGVTTAVFPILNWVLYALLAILNLLVTAGYMAYPALWLADMKLEGEFSYRSQRPDSIDYYESKFYKDLPRVGTTVGMLYLFFVVWLMILAGVVGTMSLQNRSQGSKRSIFIYIFAVLLPAFITYLFYTVINIRYVLLHDEHLWIPQYIQPLSDGISGFVLALAGYGILTIALAVNKEHWVAGAMMNTVRFRSRPVATTQYQ
ncbi:hypothetical protein BDZ91DRAFT_766679 [Kalaharituber pfeilii]|nr:hypothetical protein BDZ91DRAFT_766679 [Kalaharituber pfeilii]